MDSTPGKGQEVLIGVEIQQGSGMTGQQLVAQIGVGLHRAKGWCPSLGVPDT